MDYIFSKWLLIAIVATSFLGQLNAQTIEVSQAPAQYNTKRNYVFLNASIGGGDYPFAGLGLNLSRQFFNGKTMAGVGAHYLGNTGDGSGIGGFDPIQVFPIMADIRETFMESNNGRFATMLILDGGYVISITSNGTDFDGVYEYRNGWAINPGISFRFNVFKNMGVMADITWLHHSSPKVWLAPVDKKEQMHWDVALLRGNVFF